MHKFSLSLLLSIGALSPAHSSEGLMLKRISEFWKDEAFDQAKAQMLLFLSEHPSSDYCDNVYAMLGDLYLKEEAYQAALETYEKIVGKEVKAKVEANYLQTLYETNNLRALIQCANGNSADPRIHYLIAESCFHLGRECAETEDQKALYSQAATHYSALSSSHYAADTLWPLAEIYKTLGELPKAVSYYTELAEKNPDQAETLLFQAAYLQSGFDKKAAVRTFAEVHKMQGKNASGAAYNTLLLHFEESDYQAFLTDFERFASELSEEKLSSLQFHLAKSHFECGSLEKAASILESNSDKSSCLLLAACAEKLKDLNLLGKAIQKLSHAYPDDLDTAKTHLLSAHLSIEKGDLLRAQNNVDYVLNNFPEYPDREQLKAEYAMLLTRNTLWKESREAFQSLLHEYPQTNYKEEAWRNILHATLKEGNRELFTELLSQAIEEKGVFSEEEKEQHHLLLIKLLIEQEKRQEVAEQLIRFLESHPKSAEGFRVAALFYEEDSSSFTLHAERALSLDPLLTEAEQLHLKLYNIYIQTPGAEEKAADHLFRCAIKGSIPLKQENLLWLAGHYYNKKEDSEAHERALFLYNKTSTAEPTPLLEKEFLKHAELLKEVGKNNESLAILERLAKRQKEESELGWKLQRQALFELAQTYAAEGIVDKAIDAYEQLIGSSSHLPSYFSRAALLEKTKLKYSLLSQEKRQEQSEELQEILQSFKDLQLRKKLYSEPLHLEAALEYVFVMKDLAKEEHRDERALFLLQRVKEDFTLHSDIASKDYHSQRAVLPEQAALLENYLRYIDAEMMRLEGKRERAEKQLLKLQEDSAHPALIRRIRTSMDALYDPS